VMGKAVGTFGNTGTCAFYPNKQITTGEGGAVITSDEQTANLCRSWRNQGRSDFSNWLQHERLGYNYRLSDVNCAIGVAQLERLQSFLVKRKSVADLYSSLLRPFDDVIIPASPRPDVGTSWFVYVVRLADSFSALDRDKVMSALDRAGIGCNKYFPPIHLQPFFRQRFGYAPGDFPVTEHVAQRTIALPFHNNLSPHEVEYVVAALRSAVQAVKPLSVAVA
jgi:perosamine synthetase